MFKKRLKALEAKVAQKGIVLTEAQLQALEKKKETDEAMVKLKQSIQDILARTILSM